MKRIAYVIADDLLHSYKRYRDVISGMFDANEWSVVVLKSFADVCCMISAPDLIVSFKDSRDNWRLETPNIYEDPMTYKLADFVTKDGCGYIAVHAGVLNLPDNHPLYTAVLKGKADAGENTPVFKSNLLFGRIPNTNPFGTFADVTFTPECVHPVLEGVKEFTSRDEQLDVKFAAPEKVDVIGYVSSEAAGKTPAVWVTEAGKGRAVGISMGHLPDTLSNENMLKLLKNAVAYCSTDKGE